MRGRWASAAIGAGIARRRMGNEMEDQSRAYENQLAQQQRQIESLQQQNQQPQQQPQTTHDDITQKLKKYGELKQQGILSEEEFQKLKADLLSKI
jgi:multidrug resistance efflux pump